MVAPELGEERLGALQLPALVPELVVRALLRGLEHGGVVRAWVGRRARAVHRPRGKARVGVVRFNESASHRFEGSAQRRPTSTAQLGVVVVAVVVDFWLLLLFLLLMVLLPPNDWRRVCVRGSLGEF